MGEAMQLALQALIDLEATQVIGAARHERSDARTTHRNGSRARLLSRPRPATWSWPSPSSAPAASSSLPEPRRRIDRALWAVVAQPDAAAVGDQLDAIAAKLGRQSPAVETMLRGAAPDICAFATFPVAHWKKIWSTSSPTRRAAATLLALRVPVGSAELR